MLFRKSLLSLGAAAVLAACDGGPSGPPQQLTALPRALTVAESDVVNASNAFAFNLFRRSAARPDSNTFVSPLSVSMALGMTLNGAAGTTFDAMRATLGYGTTPLADVNAGYQGLIALLRGLDATTEMRIANSVWHDNGFVAQPAFLDATRTFFGAQVTPLDFSATTAPATINKWVSDATTGRITSIVDAIDPNEVMFLINAIYFKGRWRSGFDRAKTHDADFHAVGGVQRVPMMQRLDTLRVLSTPLFEAVDLPYGNSAFSMTVLLPANGVSVEGLVDSLTPDRWAAWMGQFHAGRAELRLPRFRLEYARALKDDLSALGMAVAFDPNAADFSRLADGTYITRVAHKTFVEVNEAGTEAAAVTSVGIGVVSMPPSFSVDRPFVFAIRERFTGTILFLGKVVRIPAM